MFQFLLNTCNHHLKKVYKIDWREITTNNWKLSKTKKTNPNKFSSFWLESEKVNLENSFPSIFRSAVTEKLINVVCKNVGYWRSRSICHVQSDGVAICVCKALYPAMCTWKTKKLNKKINSLALVFVTLWFANDLHHKKERQSCSSANATMAVMAIISSKS